MIINTDSIFKIMIVIELLLLIIGFIKKNYKIFNLMIFSEISFMVLFSILFELYDTKYGDGDLMTVTFGIFFLLIIQIIPFIIGVFGKKRLLSVNMDNKSKPNALAILGIIIGIVICSFGYILLFNNTKNNIYSFVINSLNNRYGDNDFKIINLKVDHNYYGLNSYINGYNITVKDKNNIQFECFVGADSDSHNLEGFKDDYLLTIYQSELSDSDYIQKLNDLLNNETDKLNNYFKDKYNLNFYAYEIDIDDVNIIVRESIPQKNNNKIPNVEETLKLIEDHLLTHNIMVEISSNNVFSNYQKSVELVARGVNNYYNNISDFEADVTYRYYYNGKEYGQSGYFVIDKNNIYINKDSNLINKDLSECKKIPK